MKKLSLSELNIEPEERAELEVMMEQKQRFLAAIKHDPEVAMQFLQAIGLLDADGNRVSLPGEEHLHRNGHGLEKRAGG